MLFSPFFLILNYNIMANHVLSLEVLDTLNTDIFRIIDTSIYLDSPAPECLTLQVTLPGFNYSVEFIEPIITQGFVLNLTACDLEIQNENCGSRFTSLPDGIYVLRYSVSPNDIVFVEYNHLRMTKLLNNYQKILCSLDLADCEPDIETEKKLKVLREIRMYMDAAKAKVEICHEPKKGMQLFTYAKKLLSKFDCGTCY